MADGTHLIVTVERDHSLSAESPQLPGFVMGRPTETEFRRDYLHVLREMHAEFPIHGHRQWRYDTPEGVEYLVRISEDQIDERIRLSHRLMALMGSESRQAVIDRAVPTATGEILFVCALPGDRIRFLTDQLAGASNDAAVLVVPIAEDGIWTTELAVADKADRPGWHQLTEFGLTQESTVSELMMSLGIEREAAVTFSDQRLLLSA